MCSVVASISFKLTQLAIKKSWWLPVLDSRPPSQSSCRAALVNAVAKRRSKGREGKAFTVSGTRSSAAKQISILFERHIVESRLTMKRMLNEAGCF